MEVKGFLHFLNWNVKNLYQVGLFYSSISYPYKSAVHKVRICKTCISSIVPSSYMEITKGSMLVDENCAGEIE